MDDSRTPSGPSTEARQLFSPPVRIALMFGAFGVLWILLTDRAVELVAGPLDPDLPSTSTLQSIKGLLFIVLSTLLVFWLARREHKRALALATSERRLSRLVDELGESRAMLARTEQLAHIGSWEYDVASGKIRWSEGMYTIYEMDPSLPAPDLKDHGRILHPDDFPAVLRAVAAAVAEGTGYDMVVRIVRGNGEVRDVFVHGRAVRAAPGQDGVPGPVIHLYGSLHDITDKRRAEKERETLVTAIEHTAEAIIVTDLEGRIEYVNPAFEAITGFSRAEAVGNHPLRSTSDVPASAFVRETWTDRSQGQSWTGRQIHRKQDGHTYTAELSISPVTDPSGRIERYVVVERDVSHEVELERQLLQSQKMDAIGRLAGGIAHDFNNILTGITGFTSLAIDSLAADDPAREDLAQVVEAASRAASLTRQLLGFARRQTAQPKVLDLGPTVTPMLDLLRRIIGEHIALRTHFAPDLWPIQIDPSQLDQVMTNLLVNAKDAIRDVGQITITATNAIIGDELGAVGLLPGDFVRLEVSDTGSGMDALTLERIFEPFFTTKNEGHGTGLGLATVYGIVRQNGGFIDVQSTVGEGTTMRIHLPRHLGDATPQGRRELNPTPHGKGTLLVVEDDALLRALVERLLKGLGYDVLSAASPRAALTLAADHPEHFDLLVTDVIMPEMNGLQLYEQLEKLRPGLRCLYISGYPAEVIAKRGLVDDDLHFLQKPFTQDGLAHAVAKALGGATA